MTLDDAITVAPSVGLALFSHPKLRDWSPWAIEWNPEVRFAVYPEITQLRSMLCNGVVPEMGAYGSAVRLAQLRADGWNIPDAWKAFRPTLGEKEAWDILIESRVVCWPEMVVPIPGRGRAAPPWRLDFLLIGCMDPVVAPREPGKPWAENEALQDSPAPKNWALVAIEVDGPQHDDVRDASRDRAVFEHHGITTVRVKSEWMKTDPWASLSHVFRRVGIRSSPFVRNVQPLASLDDYVCAVCEQPIQRLNVNTLHVHRGVIVTHETCAANAPAFVDDLAAYAERL